MRRYAGFYAANVRLRIQRAREANQEDADVEVIQNPPAEKIAWAKLIARIFGEMPTKCPRCGEEMKLMDFVFDTRILTDFLYMQRAPPKITITKYSQLPKQPVVEKTQAQDPGDFVYEQKTPNYEDADQSKNW